MVFGNRKSLYSTSRFRKSKSITCIPLTLGERNFTYCLRMLLANFELFPTNESDTTIYWSKRQVTWDSPVTSVTSVYEEIVWSESRAAAYTFPNGS
jgi:hypothetical protein